jgi:hypothetical protein
MGRKQEADQLIENTKAIHARLSQEHAWLQQRLRQGQQHHAQKQTRAGQLELIKLCPAIQQPQVREGFMQWLAQEHGIPRSHAESEPNPQVVAKYFREFQKHVLDNTKRALRAVIARDVPMATRGQGSAISSADARKALREGGKFDDALNLFALRRAERSVGLV